MSEVFSGNKGEWSEPYVLLKLLSDGKLYLGDGNLNKLENLMLPIISILREEQDGTRKYSYSDDKARVVFDFGAAGELLAVPLDEFEKHARHAGAVEENFTQAQDSHTVAIQERRTLRCMVFVTQERTSP